MFFIPKFTTHHDFIREYPDGSWELVSDEEIIKKKPTDVILVKSKCIEWFFIEYCYSEVEMEFTYEKI